MAISAVDLALWDLVGKIKGEPVYNLIGGLSRDEITFYCTTPEPLAIKELGFWGAKVPLPHSPFEGREGLKNNVAFLAQHRAAIGTDYPLMVDCYMSLTVPYAIELAEACKDLNIYWWEEVLTPEDTEGYRAIRAAHPTLKWTTGEHPPMTPQWCRMAAGLILIISSQARQAPLSANMWRRAPMANRLRRSSVIFSPVKICRIMASSKSHSAQALAWKSEIVQS